MDNEWAMPQSINALIIDHSLNAEHCPLIIVSGGAK